MKQRREPQLQRIGPACGLLFTHMWTFVHTHVDQRRGEFIYFNCEDHCTPHTTLPSRLLPVRDCTACSPAVVEASSGV